MSAFLSELQSFLLSLVKEKWEPASPISLIIAAAAVSLYAFKVDLYALLFALAISMGSAGRRIGVVLRMSATAAAFTAVIYALGMVLARSLPQEALPTFYRVISSASLLGAFVALRGFTPTALSLICIGVDGAAVVSMLKTVLLSPNALQNAVSAYKALRGRLDLQGAAFAVAYMLRRMEVRYREVYTVSTMLIPRCKKTLSLWDLPFIAAIAIWPFV